MTFSRVKRTQRKLTPNDPNGKVVLDIDVALFDFNTDFNMQNHLVFTLGLNHLKYKTCHLIIPKSKNTKMKHRIFQNGENCLIWLIEALNVIQRIYSFKVSKFILVLEPIFQGKIRVQKLFGKSVLDDLPCV